MAMTLKIAPKGTRLKGCMITVMSPKGGTGKTTEATNIAAVAAAKGYRVLLGETDPQGNAADAVGQDHRHLKPPTIYEGLWGRMATENGYRPVEIEECIRPTEWGFDLLPANNDLAGLEWEPLEIALTLLETGENCPDWLRPLLNPRTLLRDRLAPIRHRYDLIVWDTPPSLGNFTFGPLVAADRALLIVQCEHLASRESAVEDTWETFELARQWNPQLELDGVILTMFDARRNHDVFAVENAKKYWRAKGVYLYPYVIARAVAFADSTIIGKPAVLVYKDARVVEQRDLAEEVLARAGLE